MKNKVFINKENLELEILRLKSFHRKAMSKLENEIWVTHRTIRNWMKVWYLSEDVYEKLVSFWFTNIIK